MELTPQDGGQVFMETTTSDHDHGGTGWLFGEALWSPQSSQDGRRIYELMLEPQVGDLVLHNLDGSLVGASVVASPCQVRSDEPPSPGRWKGQEPFYRIGLSGFEEFPEPIPLPDVLASFDEEIRAELAPPKPSNYPFCEYGALKELRSVQGKYLTRITPGLLSVFRSALSLPGEPNSPTVESGREEFTEARRQMRERSSFARNPKLVKAAKERYGLVCQIREFDFGEKYGEVGEGYIECHHLDPLAERPEAALGGSTSTSLDDVIVVCSNCHRMLHRRRPALDPEELRAKMDLC